MYIMHIHVYNIHIFLRKYLNIDYSFCALGLDHGIQDFVTPAKRTHEFEKMRFCALTKTEVVPSSLFRMVSKTLRSIPVIKHQLDTH